MLNLIRITAVLVVAVGLAGCGQSEPKNENPNLAAKMFLGTWVENRDAAVGNRGPIDEDAKLNGKLVMKDDGTYEFSFVDLKGQPAEAGQTVSGKWTMQAELTLQFEATSNAVTKPELVAMVPTALTRVMKGNTPEYPSIKVDQIFCPTEGGGRWYNKQP